MNVMTPKYALILVAAVCLSGCGINACEQPERYAGSGQTGSIVVPDDLTPINSSNALQVPDVDGRPSEPVAKRGDCLESPPEYFPEGLPR